MKLKQLFSKYPGGEFGRVMVKRSYEYIGDEWGDENSEVEDNGWEIYLDHSCDEWVIGDATNATEMIINLTHAIEYCKSNP